MPQEITNLSLAEYFFDRIDLVDKLILDAGTGPGQTTGRLVNKVIETGKSSRIISIDHDQKALILNSITIIGRFDRVE